MSSEEIRADVDAARAGDDGRRLRHRRGRGLPAPGSAREARPRSIARQLRWLRVLKSDRVRIITAFPPDRGVPVLCLSGILLEKKGTPDSEWRSPGLTWPRIHRPTRQSALICADPDGGTLRWHREVHQPWSSLSLTSKPRIEKTQARSWVDVRVYRERRVSMSPLALSQRARARCQSTLVSLGRKKRFGSPGRPARPGFPRAHCMPPSAPRCIR